MNKGLVSIPAESTLLAVELLLIYIVIETTHRTEVKCKVQRTAGTVLGNLGVGRNNISKLLFNVIQDL